MTRILFAAASMAVLAGCASMAHNDGAKAIASLEPTAGNTARGSVTFVQRGDKVQVTARLSGLKPNAEHGFHVHERGNCSSADGMSAGGHFNPAGRVHGPQGAERHAGDLPNVKADANGNANATFEVTYLKVGFGHYDVIGKGLVVHRDADDYKSQPAGNSGPRIACAVIQAS